MTIESQSFEPKVSPKMQWRWWCFSSVVPILFVVCGWEKRHEWNELEKDGNEMKQQRTEDIVLLNFGIGKKSKLLRLNDQMIRGRPNRGVLRLVRYVTVGRFHGWNAWSHLMTRLFWLQFGSLLLEGSTKPCFDWSLGCFFWKVEFNPQNKATNSQVPGISFGWIRPGSDRWSSNQTITESWKHEFHHWKARHPRTDLNLGYTLELPTKQDAIVTRMTCHFFKARESL